MVENEMKKILLLIGVLFLLVSCELEPFPSTENSETEETIIEEKSELFNCEDDVFVFETNDTSYLTDDGYTLWCVKYENKSESFENIQVTASKESGKDSPGFGIVFLQQEYEEKDYLLTVMINTKGQYTVGKVIDGNYKSIINWKSCKSLNKGYGALNKIEVSLIDSVYMLKLNDVEVTTFAVTESVKIQNSKWGYVAVLANNEKFPGNPVVIKFKK
jgi:hypothetical protein